MIKAITVLRPAATTEDYDLLSNFFLALGFSAGVGWKEESGMGASFRAPMANLEFFSGQHPATGDVLIEVTSLDAIHQAVGLWLNDHAADKTLTPITETHWKSRSFTAEPVAGHAFTFWAWIDPQRGKPIAIEGDLSADGMRFAIVVARWNAVITDRLLDGALDALLRSGALRNEIEIVRVPGAWEIPAAVRTIAMRAKSVAADPNEPILRPPLSASHSAADARVVDAIIPLGCLIRGETAHYEAIYNEVARGIGQSQQDSGIPHSFGVLTCETLEQALNRAGIKAGNKGFEAAIAAIEMVSIQRKLASGGVQ